MGRSRGRAASLLCMVGAALAIATAASASATGASALAAGESAPGLKPQVGKDTSVGEPPEGKFLVEPHLAAHPIDPGRLLAVGWAMEPDYSEAHCLTFTSSDGGETWTRRKLEVEGCADPWVTLTPHRALLTTIGKHPALQDDARQLLAFFSADDGSSWSLVPQSLGRYHDGPRSLAAGEDTLYVTAGENWRDLSGHLRFGVFVGRARPGTPHVETRNRVLPSNLNQVADGAAILSDGALIVTYDDYQRPVGGPERAFRSRDGALEARRAWAMISTDEGATFSPPMLVTESCYGRPTFLAVDTTDGPSRDRLYHVCGGDDYKSILLASSGSRGEEWTDASPIETPAEQVGSRREPQVAVNREGIVAVAWMDRRDDPSGDCYAPYFAASADGGATFSRPVRVASEVSCPDPARTGRAGGRFPTGGDYFGLVAAADGRFHVLWPDARDGVFELRTASVTAGGPKP